MTAPQLTNDTPESALSEQPPSETALLRIPEAARELRVGERTVYRMIATGELESVDVALPGARKSKTRVSREALRAYINARTTSTAPPGRRP